MATIKEGEALFAQGKFEEAEQCFLEIVDRDSKNTEAYNNLGVIALERQNFEQAVSYFVRSLEIDPFNKDAVVNFSVLLKSLNKLHEAGPLLEKIIERYPHDEEIKVLVQEAIESKSIQIKGFQKREILDKIRSSSKEYIFHCNMVISDQVIENGGLEYWIKQVKHLIM